MLEWYWNLEDHCTLVLCRKPPLPLRWRREALRIRRDLARIELPFLLSPEARKARYLDDMWQEVWSICPLVADAITIVLSLSKLRGKQRIASCATLEKILLYTWRRLTDIRESPQSMEVFQTYEQPLESYSSRHLQCCPLPPFPSLLVYAYPPASMLDHNIIAIRSYIYDHCYIPAKQVTGLRIEKLEEEFHRRRLDQFAYNICRTFAGVEDVAGQNSASLIPFFYSLILAGFTCPNYLRPWLWHKLAHFEDHGTTFIAPLKKKLSIYWDIPELWDRDFSSFKAAPLGNRRGAVSADTIDAAANVASLEDSKGFELMEGEMMESDE